MKKKSLDKKKARIHINDSREKGKSDQEIYFELTQMFFDKNAIATLITGTPKKENLVKYKIYNNILLALIGVTILFKILIVLNISFSEGNLWAMVFVIIVPLINVYFFYEIARLNGPMYKILGLLTIASFLQTIGDVETAGDLLINGILLGSIAGLAFFLSSNMFPDLGLKKLKKDNNGDYLFEVSKDCKE